jgi:predicted peroxiredoxin
MGKYAFVLYTDPDQRSEMVKAQHALQAALELKKKGHDVKVFFDGLGMKVPIHDKTKELVEKLSKENAISGACGYCASPPHVNVAEKLRSAGLNLIGNEHDHRDISMFIDEGYQLMIV